MRGLSWARMRESTAVADNPALLRAQDDDGDFDGDAEETAQPCPDCDGTGIKAGAICPTCEGAGTLMRESTRGAYWVYSDDPEWEQLREADHPEWAEMQEAPRTFSGDVRKKYAGSGVAMPDGSYPIPDKDALGRAVKAIGRASDPAAAKRHIIKRAAALGATDMLPDDWSGSREAGKDNLGDKRAPLFGKLRGKDKKEGDDKTGSTREAGAPEDQAAIDHLNSLEDQVGLFRQLREAQPAKMTPAFSQPVRVKTDNGREGYQVVLIREGRGNQEDDQWYAADAIRELCESGVAEGMQAFSNHPDLEEEELRPERDIKEVVGTYHDVKFKESGGKALAEAVFVPLTLDTQDPHFGWVVTLAEAAVRSTAPQPICGISLYGLSAGDDGQRPDGSFGRIVNMIRPQSGDIVTNAGAGGGFIRQLMESARALRQHTTKELDPMQAMAYQNAVKEAVGRVREAATDEERTAALEQLAAIEAETIDSAPDSVEQLREAAPKLVQQIETATKAEAAEDTEQLRSQLREAQTALGQFTDAIGITDALRDAGVTEPTEVKHFAGMARQRGLREAEDIKDMVETEKAYHKQKSDELVEQMRESIGGLDLDVFIEGAGGRVPTDSLPSDGGVATLREAGVPIKVAE